MDYRHVIISLPLLQPTTISSRFLTILLLLNSKIIRESFLGSKTFGSSVPARNATKYKTLCNSTTAEPTGTMNTPRDLSGCI